MGVLTGSSQKSLQDDAHEEDMAEESNESPQLAGLTGKNEEILTRNLKELSTVEGNILSINKDIKTIYVTSCSNLEGKTTAALSMAYAMSMNGHAKVLLVDGNLSFPKIHELFGIEIAPGLTNLMDPEIDLNSVLTPTKYTNLTVMPAGSHSSEETDLRRENFLEETLGRLSGYFDCIIFDGCSVLESSDATVVTSSFDGTVLVIECEKTKWEVVQMVTGKIKMIGGSVLGTVLNKRKYYIPRSLYGKI